jgi:histidinol dehydrogenase
MRVRPFAWEGAAATATMVRSNTSGAAPARDVTTIKEKIVEGGDQAVLRYTARLDATERDADSLSLVVGREERLRALDELPAEQRQALEMAAANIRAVAEAQIDAQSKVVTLPQGQTVTVREVPVKTAGVYAPGGQAVYPSSVLMCAIPARVAGVERLVLASPPGPDGQLAPMVLAAAELCDVDEVYAMGGAQAIFALAYGTDTISPVDVIAGPGNAWVQEAKRDVQGLVGIDSYAGPSELMLIADDDSNPRWAAFDLCAQAEHGPGGVLVAAAVEESVLGGIVAAAEQLASEREIDPSAFLASVCVPSLDDAIDLANALAPEHLELLNRDPTPFADRVTTAGCVFVGASAATAFGDYAAGSNHVLPTGGTGRHSGPLGPGTFRRKISTVEVPPDAAAKLAPHVKVLAEAEGFPVHGESAMIRAKDA